MHSREKGNKGEDRAVDYLLEKGYRIVSRNYQSRSGEIDCVAQAPDGTLVFVEVKSARSSKNGHPFSWVTRAKQLKIARMARQYLADHKLTRQACRFDVIAIYQGEIQHLKNAFLV
ncbi:MAG: YraN family protein [Chitinivibrionales bacterium]